MATIEQQILEQIRQLRVERPDVTTEQKWIQQRLDDEQLRALVPKLSVVSIHIATALLAGELTGIELARQLNVTRGGVTRAAKSLLKYQLVVGQKHPDDQKKIFYSLTPEGQKLAIVHQQMHEQMDQTFTEKMNQRYTVAELTKLSQMLADMQQMEREFI